MIELKLLKYTGSFDNLIACGYTLNELTNNYEKIIIMYFNDRFNLLLIEKAVYINKDTRQIILKGCGKQEIKDLLNSRIVEEIEVRA